MRVPVSSYPYERWALEVVDLLSAAGINASIDRRGPRAYQVVVPPGMYHVAGATLADLGYFACSAVPSPSMAGVKDWRPDVDQDEIDDMILSVAREWADRMANDSAAITWSIADDQMVSDIEKMGYEDPWVMAEFDYSVAVNGELLEEGQPSMPPPGYELMDLGGDIPVVEDFVSRDSLIHVTQREASAKLGIPVDLERVMQIVAREYGTSNEITVGASGEATVYAKPKKEQIDG